MPINLAVEMGADEVIAVDLEAIGVVQDVKYDNVKITYIRPKNEIGSFLVFDRKLAVKAIKYGYYDTMKIFKELDGNKYTFKKGNLIANYNRYSIKFLNYCDKLFKENEGIYDDILKLSFFNRIFKTRKEYELKKIFNETIELLGKVFEIDTCNLYDIKKYNKSLLSKIKKQEEISKDFIEKKIKDKKFKDLLNTSSIIKYLYNRLDNNEINKELCALASIFPKEFVCAIYLKVIK